MNAPRVKRGSSNLVRGESPGLTTVELLVVIVLLAVALSLALPSYRAMIEKRRLVQGTEQTFAFLNTAQSIAVRSNSTITVSWSRSSDVDWCLGAIQGGAPCDCTETDSEADDFCSVDGAPSVLASPQIGKPRFVEPETTTGALTYEPIRGILEDPSDAIEIDFHSLNDDYRLRLAVAGTGQSSICSVDGDHHVPGYEVCP